MDKLADALLEHLNQENTALPILEKQFAEVQKNIDNMLNAIQQGIFTPSTKERLEALEREKSELSVQIIKEEMSKPKLTKEQILFWIYKFRKLNPKRLDHRRRLVNSFVNSIYLYDDKIIIDCNYKEGTETITLEEIESSALGSDLTSVGAPRCDEPFGLPHFFTKNTATLYRLPRLFRKRSRSRRLLICKRIHNAFGSLPTLCECAFGNHASNFFKKLLANSTNSSFER